MNSVDSGNAADTGGGMTQIKCEHCGAIKPEVIRGMRTKASSCSQIVVPQDNSLKADEPEGAVFYPGIVDQKTLAACLETAEQIMRDPRDDRIARFRHTRANLIAQVKAHPLSFDEWNAGHTQVSKSALRGHNPDRGSIVRDEPKCPECGHSNMGRDGLCKESVPLIDKEPHGAKLCGHPCVNYGLRGAWWQDSSLPESKSSGSVDGVERVVQEDQDQNSVNAGTEHSSGPDVLSPQPPEQGLEAKLAAIRERRTVERRRQNGNT